MELDEFVTRFHDLKSQGFVASHRRGPTGVGKTLEDLLDLPENNIASPDLGLIELKAHRVNSPSLITLFTFNRKVWQMKPLEAIRQYGSPDVNGRFGMYYTMLLRPNSAGLFLYVEKEQVSVRHISGNIIAIWNLESLVQQFIRKIPALIVVSTFAEMRGDVEYFHYSRARLMKNPSAELLADQFREGTIFLDLRLHDAVTRARNHGTGFRIADKDLPNLFREVTDL